MLNLSSESRIYLCTGCTDMRKGINGLSILAQSILLNQFHKSILFVFRGKQADKIKILWWDGQVASRSTQKKHRDVCMF